ncbi:carbohydrate-binding protein [Flammeovirga yaeyamensis]|uniref:glucan endo-1,3-beta-D-glucosidase n=1 Tax=Flammeovirga yaeyamensis TaxID=367791 RepID=A0AAX1N6D7_9BACT|nr:Ig-like domain-containing protein [Flammeovirga yaeyamensis]MBB3698196.1 endoglucanase Acf2 [Flammeovirga yaeyamensis]NMF34449.1 carbohydrate-binding protein [Flammeovirga yaeyamensis]QWG01428.1 carbohydrate-binding protein [Flammeovirga yaeyamensis]
MKKTTTKLIVVLWTLLTFSLPLNTYAQFVGVGNGSYTTTFPGTDAAGRNAYPAGTPQLSENALGKPVPTNDWWSTLLQSDHANNLFNYPLAMKTTNEGLVVTYIPWGVLDDVAPITVGVENLNATKTTIADHSDWTVTMDWNDGTRHFQAVSGIGMPFVYFDKQDTDVAQVDISEGTVTVTDEIITVENARNGASFVIYAPSGSVWEQNGTTYTSTLNGKNYWSLIMLPQSTSNVAAAATTYQKYAYVFPTNTTADWTYNESTSILSTVYNVEVDVKEGTDDAMLLGLLPHQWDNLSASSLQPNDVTYTSVRGTLKMLEGNTFTTENTFHGILPNLPYVTNYSDSFDPSALNQKVEALKNESLSSWTDSYNEGQVMNRLIQTARIADQTGNIEARDLMIATVKERLEDWLTAESGEVAFLFYYNSDWTAMLGYPAGHGQDSNLNDHHFHWGYFIHAAAFMEQYEPGWAAQYGDMINLLVRDASSPNRDDDTFPYLRNFSPYAGHCWANGFASFPQGNDQESTSESMQFHSSLIHWGEISGNKEIRDLGIYLYTTEQAAVEEYWFDMYERNFKPDQQYSLVSRVWGNSYDNGTFWTADIAASYNIELYPIHGGSLYLGHNVAYVEKLWAEMTQNTQVLDKVDNPNLWYDVMWSYLAFSDPAKAIELYDDHPGRNIKFGVSDAQTYHWLHAMNALGKVDISITADSPLAAAFNKDGNKTYVAHNYSNTEQTVTFSDGYQLVVPAGKMATNKDISIEGTITSSFSQAPVGGSVDLTVEVKDITPTKVEIYNGSTLLGSIDTAPFTAKAENLTAGQNQFYAKMYDGDKFDVTNIVSVTAGFQVAFGDGTPELPGTIEAGHYDVFEGGLGQGITYQDNTTFNEGNYRKDEYVDNVLDNTEGATVGWTNGGEWLEYTVQVTASGLYDLSYRYASGIGEGGGPFKLLSDGEIIVDNILVSSTGDWGAWQTATVNNVPLTAGKHILRLAFDNGGFNIGKMTFAKTGELPYSQPFADAGDDRVIALADGAVVLDGSNSYDPDNGALTYTWVQLYGPTVATIQETSSISPTLGNLIGGEYLFELSVSNGEYTGKDQVKITVTEDGKIPPKVSITSPENQSTVYIGNEVIIQTNPTDQDGTIAKVEFFVDDQSIGSVTQAPFELAWNPTEEKIYSIHVVATDNDDKTAESTVITLESKSIPSCRGTSVNGDYDYQFSEDASNPTLTFIPNQVGMGASVCILYLSVDGGGYGGYSVTADVPFQVNAAEGQTVSFYYTYSHPEGGERNTSEDPNTYVIGTCDNSEVENTYPSVEITSPKDGDMLVEGTEITISADASDADGTVAQVEFFVDNSSIGVVSQAPYEVNWTVATGGSQLKAVATDNDGNRTTSKVISIIGRSATSCLEGEVSNGHFRYIVSDASSNPTLTFVPNIAGLGDVILILHYKTTEEGVYPGHLAKPNEPFELNAPNGSTVTFYYTYSHPEGGERNTVDDIQSFVVGDCASEAENELPTVSIATSDSETAYDVNTEITFVASASDTDGTIAQVEFFVNNASIGSLTEAPYEMKWMSGTADTYTVKAVATDNDGGEASDEMNIQLNEVIPENELPTITLSTSDNATSYTVNDEITFETAVADTDGTITKVEFFINNESIRSVSEAPFEMKWSSATSGEYVVKAMVTDNDGGTASDEINITLVEDTPTSLSTDHYQVNYFPNPVTNSLTIDLPTAQQTVIIRNVEGKEMATMTLGLGQSQIDVSHLKSGIYFISVIGGDYTNSFKIIKQ